MLRVIDWLRQVLLLILNLTIPEAITACAVIDLTDNSQLVNIYLMILKGWQISFSDDAIRSRIEV